MIQFDEVEVRAGDRRILGPITTTWSERRIGVIGANGSGKSTLVRLINGLVKPTAGTVRVDGVDVATQGRRVRSGVGFVFTDPSAQMVMPTAVEDVALSLTGADARARALEVLERFGLGEHAEDSVHTLSGGQQQLLALASVLASEPAILIADEPTTLLDLAWRNRIVRLLAELPQRLIVVTHDLDHAATFERVLVIDEGHIAFDGAGADAVAAYRAVVS